MSFGKESYFFYLKTPLYLKSVVAKRVRQGRLLFEVAIRHHHGENSRDSEIAEKWDEQRQHDTHWNISTRIDSFFSCCGDYIKPHKTEEATSGSGKNPRSSVRGEILSWGPVSCVYMPQADADNENNNGQVDGGDGLVEYGRVLSTHAHYGHHKEWH